MITKEKAIEVIKSLPDEFSIEDLMDRMILLNKIEIGLKQAEAGETYTTEQAKRMVKEWSK
jgi:predicted transcriptional regulator